MVQSEKSYVGSLRTLEKGCDLEDSGRAVKSEFNNLEYWSSRNVTAELIAAQTQEENFNCSRLSESWQLFAKFYSLKCHHHIAWPAVSCNEIMQISASILAAVWRSIYESKPRAVLLFNLSAAIKNRTKSQHKAQAHHITRTGNPSPEYLVEISNFGTKRCTTCNWGN